MKKLMLGNEAIAQGALEAGVNVAAGYPGTPSTEIIENIVKISDIYCEWAPNEKVAVEVALGASIAGGRALATMKHVGLNVAADPLFTASYTGVNGGLVIIVADDPGMHSSQNEQDSRFYARSAHVPMVEPSDSQEAKDYLVRAFEISEEYDTPVLLRITTRIAHARSTVEQGPVRERKLKEYVKSPAKYVMMPGMARGRHIVVEARENRMKEDCNAFDLNRIEMKDASLGVVCSGAAYDYVKEALPNASVLKLGMVYPLPEKLVRDFASKVKELIVVEDMEPFFEDAIKAMGIPCSGKDKTGLQGELFVKKIAAAYANAPDAGPHETKDIPMRPPVLCPGCPHRAVFYVLKKLNLNVSADIGCYTLGAMPPLSSVDSVVCMGASIGIAMGMEKARGREFAQKTVAVIGDSTFIHSGITGLIDMVYNKGMSTVIIVDNSTTGMTGHQENPSTGKNVRGQDSPQLNLEKLCEAIGVQSVRIVDPFELKQLEKIVKEETARDAVSVILCRRPCALLSRSKKTAFSVGESCKNCGSCLKLGCPAIVKTEKGVSIDASQCNGCGLCAHVCAFNALKGANL